MAKTSDTCWAIVCQGAGIIRPTISMLKRDAIKKFGGKGELKRLPLYRVQKFELREI